MHNGGWNAQSCPGRMQVFPRFVILLGTMLLGLTGCIRTEWEPGSAASAKESGGVTVLTREELLSRETAQEQVLPETAQVEEFLEQGTFEEDFAGTFAYDSLSEDEQSWYRIINYTLGNMLADQELSETGLEAGLDEQSIDRIFQCVLNDHPEYFYVEGYTYTRFTRLNNTVKLEFSGTYSMQEEEALFRQTQIRNAADLILSGIDSDAGDYEKIKYVYEYLIRNTRYDLTASDNQNIYSVFVGRASVCQGYAKATQYLLNRMGVMCTLVAGTVDTGEGHAWNLVKSSGEYYYLDTTWGDASYMMENQGSGSEGYLPEINYDYLCITTEQLLRTHTPGGVVELPLCRATADNYYIREGLYFAEMDEEHLRSCFAAVTEGEDITVKCADRQVYDEMYRFLIEEQGIFDCIGGEGGTVAYALNEKQLSMTFWLAK